MSRILVACHDAGGAEIVSSWVLSREGDDFRFVLEGPARAVFERKLGAAARPEPRAGLANLEGIDLVLTGSSVRVDLEKRAVVAARRAGVRSATYLEHWTNFQRRFELNGTPVLPDEIWVGDEHAFDIASRLFRDVTVRLEPNRYLEDVVERVRSLESALGPRGGGPRVLYLSGLTAEVVEGEDGELVPYGYDEFEALVGYLDYLAAAEPIEALRLRLHPAEPPDKYDEIVERYRGSLPIEVSLERDLALDCAWADWIVGCDTMAMVVGVLAGKRVFSCIPPGGWPLSLPYPEIERLF